MTTTRPLALVAVLCVLVTAFVAWRAWHPGGARTTTQPLAATSPEAAELTRWAAAVRSAAPEAGAALVAERFHADVPPDRRAALARQVALRMATIDTPSPLSVQASTGAAVKAVWRCKPPAGGPSELALLFVRRDDGRLWLSGLMP